MFNPIGERNPDRNIARLHELTRHLWQGEGAEGFHDYDGKIPIIVTSLKKLREQDPAGWASVAAGGLAPLLAPVAPYEVPHAAARGRRAAPRDTGRSGSRWPRTHYRVVL
ncbi:hypothetical protein ACFY9A_39095 [Streptomyces rubradiris]|uniref:hypothetical protein n=1 Tax=Streptomyces rubradiris TaxID=285531 RepID=UPI0036E21715